MRSILFVCRANMCRSPSAEGVLRKILEDRGASARFDVQSAGTHEFRAGCTPDVSAIAAAAKRGYDISGCHARRIAPGDFDHFDMILAMDSTNLEDLRRVAPTRSKQKIERLLEY